MSRIRQTCVIRANANKIIGHGHLMRCLAIAQEVRKRGGEVYFATNPLISELIARLKNEGINLLTINSKYGSLEDADRLVQIARETDVDWIILDGYAFDYEYQRRVVTSGFRTLVIDDDSRHPSYDADLLLNPNVSADRLLYHEKAACGRLLLGKSYTLLRQEFLNTDSKIRDREQTVERLFVTLGGGDHTELLSEILKGVQFSAIPFKLVTVITGSSNIIRLKEEFKDSALPLVIKEYENNMPRSLYEADLAITGAGGTCWEMAHLGLPMLMVVLAKNQEIVARSIEEAGAGCILGNKNYLSAELVTSELLRLTEHPDELKNMSEAGQNLVDGKGASRLVDTLEELTLKLEPADESHARLLWSWVNDTEVRSQSFTPESIPWENHLKWYKDRLNDPGCRIYIALNNSNIPVGQVRFERNAEGWADVDVSIDVKIRSSGLGAILLRHGLQRMSRDLEVYGAEALVKHENVKSIRAFEKAGFRAVEDKKINDGMVRIFHWQKDLSHTRTSMIERVET